LIIFWIVALLAILRAGFAGMADSWCALHSLHLITAPLQSRLCIGIL